MKKLYSALLLVWISSQVNAGPTALTNVNLIDVNTLTIIKNQTVLIDDKHIQRIANSDEIDLSPDTVVVDLKDKFLSPGLIDAHVHHATDPDDWDNRSDTLKRLRNLLRGGVTSVRDMGGDTRVLSGLKREALLDIIQSPDIYYSVIIGGPEFFADPRTVSSAKGHQSGAIPWMAAITDETDLDAVMLKALGTGATGIKIYAAIDQQQIAKLTTAAKKHGLKVWSHVYVGPAKPSNAISAGVETISHAPDLSAEIIDNYREWRREDKAPNSSQEKRSYQTAEYNDLLNLMLKNNTILDATMTVFESRKTLNENTKKRYRHTVLLTKLAHEYGIPIAAGTDAFSDQEVMLYKELELLVNEAKLSPIQAIQAATINNAKVIGQSTSIGSIETGKVANLVVFDKNPAEDIANLDSVSHVLKNGQFIYRGADSRLPFIPAKKVGNTLWMSGQIGNLPGTMVLAGGTIEAQMHQTMKNILSVLAEHGLGFEHVTKCTLMLADIKEWGKASEVYKSYFTKQLPTRSAFAASGLALNAKAEVECIASY
ncbi:amidohydrolase family protein [Thalassotalea sp. M1531]|uniref:Amidohydrolase family protein n=1 Tax=Thalassotalea algicola TaxID=2716224 RepID=A0A7Y0Q879_9GAMM|nr:amidohydrolase family protein [Thalassotalea algicola]NMP33183.1 amidohydrolase family protein [Thalassotalea algicola]